MYKLGAVNLERTLLLKEFISRLENNNKRVILTSGTICSYNYQNLFNNKLHEEFFCNNGDPLNTNSKMVIFADNQKYISQGENSTLNAHLNEIVTFIKNVKDKFVEPLVIAHNQEAARVIQKELQNQGISISKLTYYNSTQTIGVKNDTRVCITIGLPFKATNTFDPLTNDEYESHIMNEESIHSDFMQAISRVKCPEGKEPSLVFAVKCLYEDCVKSTQWGKGRCFDDMGYVTCSEFLPQINVINSCFEDMINHADQLKNNTLPNDIMKKPSKRINTKNTEFKPLENIIIHDSIKKNPIKLMMDVIPDHFSYLVKTNNNEWQLLKKCAFKPEIAQYHYHGTKTIGFYMVSNTNMTNIGFYAIKNNENAEMCKLRLCKYLLLWHVPHYVEKINNSKYLYKVNLFFTTTEAKKVRVYLNSMIKHVDVDVDVYPMHNTFIKTKEEKENNSIELPLSINSSLCINGEFTREFTDLTISYIDLTNFNTQTTSSN